MPTPNEREIYLGSWCRTKAGSAALADLIAQYRESIIASERGAAADRLEALRKVSIDIHRVLDGHIVDFHRVARDIAAILSGQSASPKRNLSEALADIRREFGLIFDAINVDEFMRELRGEPATPLQEARDRGERLEALVSERVALYEGTTEEELEMLGLGWVVRARAALAAEGKA
jgi:hypothetical protein